MQYLKDEKQMSKLMRNILPAFLLLAGVALMALGVMRGELQQILSKAVIVCLECIGIG